MTAEDLVMVAKSLAPIVRDHVRTKVDEATKMLLERITALEQRASEPGPPGPAGKDAEPLDAQPITEAVLKVVSAHQEAERLRLDDVIAKAIAAIPQPELPVSVSGGLVDREGQLVLTLTDGQAKVVGRVAAKELDPLDVQRQIREQLEAWPKPENGKDGQPGKDGRDGADGLGFEDLSVEFDGTRELSFRLSRGEMVKTFPIRLPIPVYEGVYRPERTYEAGSSVTFGGSLWLAQAETNEKPGEGATAWRLAVKRGADGKSGPQGLPGKDGRDGRDGKNLTHLMPNGEVYR